MVDPIRDDGFEPSPEAASQDSGILQPLHDSSDLGPFKVYARGPLTVIGFGGQPPPDMLTLTQFRPALQQLLSEVKCNVLAIDLSGIPIIPSGLLGLLTSFGKSGIEVQLHNTSKDIQEVIELTKLNVKIQISS
ncbi:MAG: STAS domain-containing protein [Planctomycetota bacterium]|nr:STAS domain-containing protein [Planctomycetota bacterium]MDA1210980.1 STAS domain-containing protein [Planctomycetota bacterium]